MTDPLGTHRIDQMAAAMTELAASLAAYRSALIAHGFTRAEALALVLGYQSVFLAGTFGNRGSK